MFYFERLRDINIIREIGLYLDIEAIDTLEKSYPEKILDGPLKFIWRHYWYSRFDHQKRIKSLQFQSMPIITLNNESDEFDDEDDSLDANLKILNVHEIPEVQEVIEDRI